MASGTLQTIKIQASGRSNSSCFGVGDIFCIASSEPGVEPRQRQQQQSCGSEQREQTARTTTDSHNETQSLPAAVMKTERQVLASKPPRANAQQAAPTSGDAHQLFLRISAKQTPKKAAFQKIQQLTF